MYTNGKVKTVLLVVLAGLIAAACGGYLYWKATPQYSLRQAALSVRDHDSQRFQKYVDVERVLDHALTVVFDRQLEETAQKNQSKDEWLHSLASGVFMMMKPALVSAGTKEILSIVENAGKEVRVNMPPASRAEAPAVSAGPDVFTGDKNISFKNALKNKGFKGIDYVKKEGQGARVGIRVEDEGEELIVELYMQKKEGYWQVLKITNLEELMELAAARKAVQLAEPARPSVQK